MHFWCVILLASKIILWFIWFMLSCFIGCMLLRHSNIKERVIFLNKRIYVCLLVTLVII